jgi:hypothetical protein
MRRKGLSFLKQEVNIPYRMFVSILSAAIIAGAGAWAKPNMNRALVAVAILANTLLCLVVSSKIRKDVYNLIIFCICLIICCLVVLFS